MAVKFNDSQLYTNMKLMLQKSLSVFVSSQQKQFLTALMTVIIFPSKAKTI